MTDAHHTRAHAVFSASAVSRNSVCAGAIAMSSLCVDVEREAAAWGTAAHQISERVLRIMTDPTKPPQASAADYVGKVEKSGTFAFTVDEEMANTAQTYIDYCLGRLEEYGLAEHEPAQFWIEHRLSLESLDPPLQSGGTADCILWFPKWKLLEVIDLKGGRGVTVDVKGNPQGRTYAIGAILSLPDIRPEKVMVTIVQPRVGNGEPKSDTFHVSELLDWTFDLLGDMAKAKQALDEFEAIGGVNNTVSFDEWAEKWLTPGQCTFCQAKPVCPALRKKALAAMPALAAKWHEDVTLATPPALSNLAKVGSIEELEHDLDGIDALKEWIGARAAYAKLLAEQGTKFKNWGLVDSIGNRAWKEKDENNLCCEIQEACNLKGNDIIAPGKVKSPAQIEKLLKGEAKKKFMANEKALWVKPITGKNLVRLDKTSRPAAKTTAETFHETVEQEN